MWKEDVQLQIDSIPRSGVLQHTAICTVFLIIQPVEADV